jgi:hypothetical protein
MHTVPDSTKPIPPPRSTSTHPPPPVPPPDVVRVRVDLPGADYRRLRRIALETEHSTNEMAVEAVRLLVRYYAAQGVPADSEGLSGPDGAR